jgi:hypothetical protein
MYFTSRHVYLRSPEKRVKRRRAQIQAARQSAEEIESANSPSRHRFLTTSRQKQIDRDLSWARNYIIAIRCDEASAASYIKLVH